MSYLTIIVDGREYTTAGDESVSPQAIAEGIYAVAGTVDSIKMPLSDGRVLILPKEAVQRATFIACPGLPSKSLPAREER